MGGIFAFLLLTTAAIGQNLFSQESAASENAVIAAEEGDAAENGGDGGIAEGGADGGIAEGGGTAGNGADGVIAEEGGTAAAAVSLPNFAIDESGGEAGEPVEKVWLNGDGMLRIHRFEDEVFQIGRLRGTFSDSIRASEKLLAERHFDSLHRIEEEKIWSKEDGAFSIESESRFFYEGGGNGATRREDLLFVENKFVETDYNGDALPVLVRSFSLNDDKSGGDKAISETATKYDDQSRIVEVKFNSFDDNYSERQIFKWTKKCPQPDVEIYENGDLVKETIHKDAKNRTEITHFDDDFSIVQIFKDNTKVEEQYKHGDEVLQFRNIADDVRFVPKYLANEDDEDDEEEVQDADSEDNGNADSEDNGA